MTTGQPRYSATKLVLASDAPNVLEGYRVAHLQEARFTELALREIPGIIEVWYRYLTLFDQPVRQEHESPSEQVDDAHYAWDLRLRLTTTAMGTAKLTLDAALAGYYLQAAVLTRHLLETWRALAYVRTNAVAARRWFNMVGGRKPIVPSPSTVVKGVRRAAQRLGDANLRNNIELVEHLVEALDESAHPGWMAAAQPSVSVTGFEAFDDHARREWLLKALSRGTAAIALVLYEAARTMPTDQEWWDEFNAIAAIRSQWHTGTQPKRSLRELRETRGWNLGETVTRLIQDPTNRTQIDETLLDALERRIRAPRIDELETLASVYDISPFDIDLGPYDRLAVTPRGHVYAMHLHRQTNDPKFIARLTGWKLRNANDDSPSAYIHNANAASDRYECTGSTTDAAFASLAAAVESNADRHDEPNWAH